MEPGNLFARGGTILNLQEHDYVLLMTQDVRINENRTLLEDASQSLKKRIEQHRSPSMDNVGCFKEGLAFIVAHAAEIGS